MQVPIQIKGLPVRLVCDMYNRHVFFQQIQHFRVIYETCDSYNVLIDEDGLKFTAKDLASSQSYGYNSFIEWREDKMLFNWLKAQELVMPTFQQQNF